MSLKKEINIEDMELLIKLFGNHDENLKLIVKELNVTIAPKDGVLTIEGEEANVGKGEACIACLLKMISKGDNINKRTVGLVLDMIQHDELDCIDDLMQTVAYTAKGKPIKPKSRGQAVYIKAIQNNSIVFGIGPAGTGKTYLAVAMAVSAYKSKQVEKIILTRPAVEAGEKLGFLPGDLQTKVDPYLRPLYDALADMLGWETYNRLVEKGIIEIAPLAYMRGRTLADAFIILDEAQNATIEQMKMFLTRMGDGSRVVVTGDVTQIDLPREKKSGLTHAANILEGIEDIAVNRLTSRDVVRHSLVQKIINAYENDFSTRSEKDD